MTNGFIQFIILQGVPQETVELILMFPLVLTTVVIARQVIGIKAFGIYTPSIVAIAFLATGLKYGVFLFFLILIIATASRLVLKHLRLLYLPRTAIMLSLVSVIILLVLVLGGHFNRTGLASVSIFPLLILITIIEKFIVIQVEKGAKTAIFLSLETLVLSVVAYFVVKNSHLKAIFMEYPWLIIVIILLNLGLGKWTGLRLSEYYRFKDVIKNVQLSKKE